MLKLIRVTEEIAKTLDKMQSDIEALKSKTSEEHRDHLSCDSTLTQEKMQLIMVTQIVMKAEHSDQISPILSDKGILTKDVTCQHLSLELPIASGFPISAVSETFANEVILRNPSLSRLPLTSSLLPTVSTANRDSLCPCKTIELPITWNNGQTTHFQMLVILNLTYSIILGNNHLKKTRATIDHGDQQIHFKHQDMNFTASCHLSPRSLILVSASTWT